MEVPLIQWGQECQITNLTPRPITVDVKWHNILMRSVIYTPFKWLMELPSPNSRSKTFQNDFDYHLGNQIKVIIIDKVDLLLAGSTCWEDTLDRNTWWLMANPAQNSRSIWWAQQEIWAGYIQQKKGYFTVKNTCKFVCKSKPYQI